MLDHHRWSLLYALLLLILYMKIGFYKGLLRQSVM